MHETLPYQILADVVLALHVAVAAFIVGGLVLIVVGNLCGWRWVNALWFRLAHLAAIVFVVAEAWIDIACPLTSLEMWLREKAHAASYAGELRRALATTSAVLRSPRLGIYFMLFASRRRRRGNVVVFPKV